MLGTRVRKLSLTQPLEEEERPMSEQEKDETAMINQAPALVWDEAAFLAALDAAVTALGDHAASLDALNVFPVADADTGTNLLLTAQAALRAARNVAGEGLPAVTEAAARAALRAAHGNSGMILSQVFRALAETTREHTVLDAFAFSDALTRADTLARRALLHPIEGTMITVLRAVAETAVRVAETGGTLADLLLAVRRAAAAAVARTPELLTVLRERGVVDSGAQGLAVIFDAWTALACGEEMELRPLPAPSKPAPQSDEPTTGYCLNALLYCDGTPRERIAQELARYGESIEIISDGDLLRVHLHTTIPDTVQGFLRHVGQIRSIIIDSFSGEPAVVPLTEPRQSILVVLSAAPGIVTLAHRLGAYGITTNRKPLSASSLMSHLAKLPVEQIVVLPSSDTDVEMAQQAARTLHPRLAVLPVRSLAAQLVALSLVDPERDLDETVRELQAVLARLRTVDILASAPGRDGGDSVLGRMTSLPAVALQALSSLDPEDAELCSIVIGETVGRIEPVRQAIVERWPHLQIELFWGHQPAPPLSIALE
uniref:DAK2 domain-containing protein n=1 Tax=Thermomicrobium roseum TaxID=500 RepID=A0A7C5RRR4_THERO